MRFNTASVNALNSSRLEGDALAGITLRRLIEFRRRRNRLAMMRGIALSVIVFVLMLFGAVAVDAMVPIELARWIGSLAVYSIGVAVIFWWCVRPALQPKSLLEDARLFEQADPRLRERLLAAVELSEDSREDDSLAFRQQLQMQVAQAIAPVEMHQLLPWELVRKLVFTAGLVILMLAILCCVPNLHLPHRLARTLLPLADLGRITSVNITLERPLPASTSAPQDEIVVIAALLTGSESILRDVEPILETRSSDSLKSSSTTGMLQSESIADEASAGRRFETTVVIEFDWLEYRIVAADAVSPWHRITAVARPSVEQFYKEITLPEYSLASNDSVNQRVTQPRMADTLVEPTGDITAIVGSSVYVEVQTSEPLTSAFVEWNRSNAAESLDEDSSKRQPMKFNSATKRWGFDFTIDQSVDYRIGLVSKETGYSNKFRLSHEVTAVEDLAPTIQWSSPSERSIVVIPQALLAISATVQDEFSVAELTAEFRINDGGWQAAETVGQKLLRSYDSQPLDFRMNRIQETVRCDYDLAYHALEAGDELELKWVAVDRLGQRSESEILTIAIASFAVETALSESEELRQQVANKLEALANEVEQVDLATPNSGTVDSEEAVLTNIKNALPEIEDAIELAKSQPRDLVSAGELRRLGRAAAALKAQSLAVDGLARTGADEKDSESARGSQIAKMISALKQLAESARTMVSHDVVSLHARQLAQLSGAERELSESAASGRESVEQLRRQQSVIAKQLSQVRSAMGAASQTSRQATAEQLRRTAESLSFPLEQAMKTAEDGSAEDVKTVPKMLSENLSQMSLPNRLDGGLHDAIKREWKKTAQQNATLGESLDRLVSDVNSNSATFAQTRAVIDQLSSERKLARSGLQSDREFAADVGTASRAIEDLLLRDLRSNPGQSIVRGNAESQSRLNDVAKSLRALEANNSLQQAIEGARNLARTERWDLDQVTSYTEQPRRWDAYSFQLEQAIKELREAGVAREQVDRLERLRWSEASKRAEKKIAQRRWELSTPISAAPELDELSDQLASVASSLAEDVEAAREKLNSLAPAVSELAQRAAEATRALEQQTRDLSKALQDDEVPDPSTRLSGLEENLTAVAQLMQRLRDALVDQADSQELLDVGELQLARQADQAINLVDQVDQQTAQSLDRVDSQATRETQVDSLTAAAEKQLDSSEALAALANQFQQLEQRAAEPTTLSPDNFAPADPDAMTSNEPSYARAEQLANLAQADRERMLRELESRLKVDRPMREEMSDIARETAERALQQLDVAANQQATVTPQLEESDPATRLEKYLLWRDLQRTKVAANQLLSTFANEAKEAARLADSDAQTQRIEDLASSLRGRLEQIQPGETNQAFEMMNNTAAETRSVLKTAARELNEVSGKLAAMIDDSNHKTEGERNNRRREMRDRQRRVQQREERDARSAERTVKQQADQAGKQLTSARASLGRDQARQAELQGLAKKEPNNESLSRAAADQQRRVDLAEREVAAAEKLRNELQFRASQAKDLLKAVNSRAQAELNGANPSAELAASLLKRMAERAEAIANELPNARENDRDEEDRRSTAATSERLQAMGELEASIDDDVRTVAEDLSRAARHEDRLGQSDIAQRIEALAGRSEKVADGEIAKTQAELNAATAASKTNSIATPEKTQAVAQAADDATAAIRNAADLLRGELNRQSSEAENSSESAMDGTARGGDSEQQSGSGSQPPSDGGRSSSPLTPREMAQLLDELDRQMASSGSDAGSQSTGSESNAPTSSGSSATPATLKEAAQRLASQMSRQRQGPAAGNETGASSENAAESAQESTLANVNPQAPVGVQVLNLDRIDGDWGKLRERVTEDVSSQGRDQIDPRYRAAIEAYFRALSEAAANSDAAGLEQ